MIKAEQNKVFQDTNLSLIDIRKREIDYFTSFFSIFSTQCFLLTTYLAIAVSQRPPDAVPADGVCGVDCPLYVLIPFAVFQASSIASNGLIILISTFVVVFGNWLAIHGREGAMIHAINGMIAEQNKVVRLFLLAVFCYQAQIFCTFFVLMDQTFAWVCGGILISFAIWTYRSVVRIYNTFKWDEVEAGWNYDELKRRMESDDKDVAWVFAELTPEILLDIIQELTGKDEEDKSLEVDEGEDYSKIAHVDITEEKAEIEEKSMKQETSARESIRFSTRESITIINRDSVRMPARDSVVNPMRDSVKVTTRDSVRITGRDSIAGASTRETFRDTRITSTREGASSINQPRVTVSYPSSKVPIIPRDEIDPDEVNKTYQLALRKGLLDKTDSNERKKEVILAIIRDKWKRNKFGKKNQQQKDYSKRYSTASELRNSFRKSVMESFSFTNNNNNNNNNSDNTRPSLNFFQQALPDLPDIRASITSALPDLPRMSLQLPVDLPRPSFNLRSSIGAIGNRLSHLNPFRPSQQADLEKEREMNEFVASSKHVALGELMMKVPPVKSSSFFSWFLFSSSKEGEKSPEEDNNNGTNTNEGIWMKYYFVLKGNLIFYYEDEQAFVKNPSKPMNMRLPIDLNGYELKKGGVNAVVPFVFTLYPLSSENKKKKVSSFRCNDEVELNHWTERIQEVLDEIHERELAKEFM